MRTLLLVLIAIQLVAMPIGALAAVIKIETIGGTGPVLSLFGAVLAGICYLASLKAGFWYGLAAPSLAVLCFSIIFGFELSPSEAAFPIGSLIVASAMGCELLGILAFREAICFPRGGWNLRFQFRVTVLLGAMLLVALLSAPFQAGEPLVAASGLVLVYAACLTFLAMRFEERRRDWPASGKEPCRPAACERHGGNASSPTSELSKTMWG